MNLDAMGDIPRIEKCYKCGCCLVDICYLGETKPDGFCYCECAGQEDISTEILVSKKTENWCQYIIDE